MPILLILVFCIIDYFNSITLGPICVHRTKKKRQNDRENLKKIGNSRRGNGMRNQGGIQ